MPPKPSKKAVDKQKQKVIEDKTFGLKNKNKSAKVQKYVQNVTKTVSEAGQKKVRCMPLESCSGRDNLVAVESKRAAKEEQGRARG